MKVQVLMLAQQIMLRTNMDCLSATRRPGEAGCNKMQDYLLTRATRKLIVASS